MKTVRIMPVVFIFLFIAVLPVLHAEGQKSVSLSKPVPADRWTGPDKRHHFFTSAVLTGFGFVVIKSVARKSTHNSLLLSSSVTLSIGALKELRDTKSKTGHASFKDMVANALGISVAFLLMKSV